jgi:sialidase-1
MMLNPAMGQDSHDAGGRSCIVRHVCVSAHEGEYYAWPSMTRAANGDLIVVFTRTEEHLSPDGAIMLSRSSDGGVTWLPPTVLTDSPLDDRESGLTTLKNGWIVGHFWSTFHTRAFYESLAPASYAPEVLERWIRFVERPEYRNAKGRQGAWTAVSKDAGKTWSPLVRGHDSVHGGIELADGSLLLASYRESNGGITIYATVALDSPWQALATVHSPTPDSIAFGEPHLLQIPSGRVLMMIRATTKPYDDGDPRCVLWESYSDDGGKTWVRPFPTPLWGFPPHLTMLGDGRVLCTYGYRRPPYGQRACISGDGTTWDPADEIVLRDDAPNSDLGYPASLEIEPGLILTVYYQPDVPRGTIQQMRPPDPLRTKPGILGTIWRIPHP